MLRLQIAAGMTAGFGNYFDSALDSRAQHPRARVVTKGLSSDGFFYFSNAFEHVMDTQQRRARSHLENPHGLGLNLFTNERMEPIARGEVHLDAKPFFQQSF